MNPRQAYTHFDMRIDTCEYLIESVCLGFYGGVYNILIDYLKQNIYNPLFSFTLSETAANHPANVVIEQCGTIPRVDTTVACDVACVAVVADIPSRVVPGSYRAALPADTALWAEGGIFFELFRVVVGVDVKGEVGVADVAAGGVD